MGPNGFSFVVRITRAVGSISSFAFLVIGTGWYIREMSGWIHEYNLIGYGLRFHQVTALKRFPTKKAEPPLLMAARLSRKRSPRKTGVGKTRNFPSQPHDWFGFIILINMILKNIRVKFFWGHPVDAVIIWNSCNVDRSIRDIGGHTYGAAKMWPVALRNSAGLRVAVLPRRRGATRCGCKDFGVYANGKKRRRP
ncbi:hypothetical protein HNR65_003469 [Desulfosalsimonas propionicica]|uniref:Uncharacterized protein n=1 Tax=Desulfosalsimonas propionicica TaxID=332175 RepID=A0A7W0HMB1_9BACT|nr:hypothetical protein [Desulfosalsimonas propionicica]